MLVMSWSGLALPLLCLCLAFALLGRAVTAQVPSFVSGRKSLAAEYTPDFWFSVRCFFLFWVYLLLGSPSGWVGSRRLIRLLA